ncbi:hypothetical protein VCB98_07115 [Gammaproteobacteria bacterium AB-CW1]|uniref:Uncharacterized protein n=1 Tax=Natronospira elongata TaxID=3110268 RepID=A0AAP6JEL9_9GAMM|nr:hypothetical protein [Gammaproteobacteria bacterium AB-CW1]
MSLDDRFPVSGNFWIDLLVLVVAAIGLLYLARSTAHEILLGLTRALTSTLRVAHRAMAVWGTQLRRGGQSALYQLVGEHQRRLTSRELEHLRNHVHGALKEAPALKEAIEGNIAQLERDYEAGPALPEPPAAWGELVEKITAVQDKADSSLRDTLDALRVSVEKSCQQLTGQHDRHSRQAQHHLGRLQPVWQQARDSLEGLEKRLANLDERLVATNRRIRRFETLQAQRNTQTSRFRAWLALNLGISGFLLLVGAMITLVNYHLLATPLQEAFGTQANIGPFQAAPFTAIAVTAAQMGLALLISDTARITRLLLPISRMSALSRRVLLGIASVALILLALTEAGLAFTRDTIALESEWLRRELEQGIATGSPDLRIVPAMAQMVMGFILPFAFIALVPALESFFQTARVALLLSAAFLIGTLATLTRLLARLISSAGHLLVYIYDLIIVVPLSLERRFRRREPGLGGGEEV